MPEDADGILDDSPWITCPICFGAGTQWMRCLLTPCETCKGRGQIRMNQTEEEEDGSTPAGQV
jgi:DnaJ-class molecular chaperone